MVAVENAAAAVGKKEVVAASEKEAVAACEKKGRVGDNMLIRNDY